MFGLSTDAVEYRIPPEASPNARTVRVSISHIANGARELPAWVGAGRVTPDEGGDLRVEFGADSYESRGGAEVCIRGGLHPNFRRRRTCIGLGT